MPRGRPPKQPNTVLQSKLCGFCEPLRALLKSRAPGFQQKDCDLAEKAIAGLDDLIKHLQEHK